MQIVDLWDSPNPKAWDDALERYWDFVQPRNLDLERALDALDLERVRCMDAQQWFDFLKDEYFRWKYTAPNRYASTIRYLQRYVDDNTLGDLDQIRGRLLTLDTDDIQAGLEAAGSILGLGTAGASGLLALMYPQNFGTVDQFAVKALRLVNGLPEAVSLSRMNPENLYTRDGVVIIGILRRKAAENNRVFKSDIWSPRKVDKVFWTYGR